MEKTLTTFLFGRWKYAGALAFFALFLFSSQAIGQSNAPIFFTEDFEDATVDYVTSQPECNDTGGDYFTRTDGSDISGTYNSPIGTSFFAAQDIDGSPCMMAMSTMVFDDLDISGRSNLEVCLYLAEDQAGNNDEDWDAADFFHLDYDVDNSGTFANAIWVEADPATLSTSGFNGLPRIDTDFDGEGDGAEITDVFTQYCFAIAATGTTIDLQLTFAVNAGDEDVAVDELTLAGDATPPTPFCFYTEDFEDATVGYVTSQAECNDMGGDYFTRTDGSNVGGTYNSPIGTTFFAAQDIDGSPCMMPMSTMSFDDLNIAGYTDVEFCIYLAEDQAGNNAEDWDAADYLHIDYDVDNSGTFTPMIWVEADPTTLSSSGFNGLPRIDTDFDGEGDGAEITDIFTQYCFTIPVAGDALDIEMTFALNAGDEDVAIDEVTLCGIVQQTAGPSISRIDTDGDGMPDVADPCACGDPDNLSDMGVVFFNDFVTITSDPGEMWTLTNLVAGTLYDTDLTTTFGVGTVIPEVSPGVYRLDFYTESTVGFSAEFNRAMMPLMTPLAAMGTCDAANCCDLTAEINSVSPNCTGSADGSITFDNVLCPTCVGAVEFTINGTDYQPGTSFIGLTAGTYQVFARDAGNFQCTFGMADFVLADGTPVAPIILSPPADTVVNVDAIPAAPMVNAVDLSPDGLRIWINEFHYDNSGQDVGEFIEIGGLAGTDLFGFALTLYNGSNGTEYNTVLLSATPGTVVIPDEGNGYGAIAFPIPSGIQNGAPDGFALIDVVGGNTVLQFLSYEGAFTATSGAATGMMSVDVGVAETGGTAVMLSLQLMGTGSRYSDFTWSNPSQESPNALNAGQTAEPNLTTVLTEVFIPGTCPQEQTIERTFTATSACGLVTAYTQTLTVQDTTAPVIVCQDITVELDADGNFTLTTADVVTSATDNGGGTVNLSLNITSLSCANAGASAVVVTATDECGNSTTCSPMVTVEDNIAPTIICVDDIFINLASGACDAIVGYPNPTVSDNCGTPALVQTAGPVSGSTFERNTTTTISFQATDAGGNVSTCSFDVTIVENVPANNEISCLGSVNISLDENCQAIVGADQLLTGNDYGCFDDYNVVFASGPNIGQPVLLGPGDVDVTYEVMVTNPAGIACWGFVTVESKTIPDLVCTDVTLRCDEDAAPGVNAPFPVPTTATVTPAGNNTFTVTGFGACSVATLTYTDVAGGELCDNTQSIERTYTVVDDSGNSATCTQTISIIPVTIAQLTLPPNVTLECGDDTSIANTGGIDVPCSNIVVGTTDLVIDVCAGSFKILREFTIGDWCGNQIEKYTQIIKVLDTQAPVLACPVDVTVGTTSNACSGNATITLPTATDCGGGVTFTTTASAGSIDANTITDLPLGVHTVNYAATDDCGNVATCTSTITVVDNVAPISICDEHTIVGIGSDGTALVAATTFDDGSTDNCGIVSIDARRMDNPSCPGNDATPFAATVPFTCCDLGAVVMVEFRVTDEAGNVNSCMVEVEVQDKIRPSIICPPNKTIECTDDMSPAFTGTAMAIDNCGNPEITFVDISNTVDDCGVGTIRRSFTARVDNTIYGSANCIQTITVVNNDTFDPTTIVWPLDYTLTTCGQGLEPEDFPTPYDVPTYEAPSCLNIAMTHEDTQLDFGAGDACLKILRKWIIIDWCEVADNQDPTVAGPGVYHHVQVIKVNNSTAPDISCSADGGGLNVFPNFDASGDCGTTFVPLRALATDDCTPTDLLQFAWSLSNGQTGTGNDAGQEFANGDYTITFTVADLCGNTSSCVRSFSVVDAKPPTPVCIFGIASTVMPSAGEVTIWATDFENGGSYDNCTEYADLRFSFSQDVDDTNVTIRCEDIPANGLYPVTLYVTDATGNFDFCETFISVQDPNGVCATPDLVIHGEIRTEFDEEVQDVTVKLSDDFGMNIPVVTGVDGSFQFAMIYGDYDVTPEKDINYLNGVTTYDLVLISKHILGTELLTTPYQLIAADANHSESISTLDIVKLRALILHIDDELASNTSWRFVDANYNFTTNNPLTESFNEYVDLENTSFVPVNFVGVKIGDVNSTATPNNLLGSTLRNFNGDLTLQVATAEVAANETFTVDFTAKDFKNISGYQFSLGFDNSKVEFVDVVTSLEGLTVANFGLAKLNEGVITTSWNNAQAVNLEEEATLFSLTFVANEAIKTSELFDITSRYTVAEAYSGTDLYNVTLAYNGQATTDKFELYQNTPNPFKAETSISFNLPEAGAVTLKIYDVAGRVLRLVEMDAAQGMNTLEVNRADFDATGVLYYQLETATETATKKMILVD